MDNRTLNQELLDLRDMFKKLSDEHENWESDVYATKQYHYGKAIAYDLSYRAMKDILEKYFK